MPRSLTPVLVDAAAVVHITAQRRPNMPENCSRHGGYACNTAPRYRGACDKWLVGLVFLTLVRTSEALAADQVAFPGSAQKPNFDAPRQPTPLSAAMNSIPATYQAIDLPESKAYSTQEFRPRGHSIREAEPVAGTGAAEDTPMLRGTTVWQRLSEYRAHGRVRLLTLWESSGSSVSLQAGRKGEPSLQWTSRLMNHGGATRGLLDHFVSNSLAGAGRGLHIGARTALPENPGKPGKLPELGGGALK